MIHSEAPPMIVPDFCVGVFVGARQEAGAQLELALGAVDQPRSAGGRLDDHGSLPGQEGIAGVDGRAAVVAQDALIVHALPPLQDLHALGAVEDGLGGEAVAAVVVVDVETAGNGQELLEEPAVDGDGDAVLR